MRCTSIGCLLSWVASCALLVGLSGCRVEADLCARPCLTNADCVSGYACDRFGVEEGEMGECRREAGTTCLLRTDGGGELDRDGDGFETCAVRDAPCDCDDDNAQINPGEEDTTCDGVDDNCDGVVDDEAPDRLCALQAGVCIGSRVTCEDGGYADCASEGLYPSTFNIPDICGDGLDNDCDGTVDDGCNCITGEAIACGTDAGTCTRGMAVCIDGINETECFQSVASGTCTSTASCATGSFCVTEEVEDWEDLTDACLPGTGPCTQSVCRTPTGTTACTTDAMCAANEICALGACQPLVVEPVDEICNGLDDDCNGQIDNDGQRTAICGRCPFNYALFQMQDTTFMCMHAYEASRPDATDASPGAEERYALSQPGVIPWTGVSGDEAAAACAATAYQAEFSASFSFPVPTGRLCRSFEFEQGCGGPTGAVDTAAYPYGDDFEACTCNDGNDCGGGPALTGAFPDCRHGHLDGDVYDASGNVAEWIEGAGGVRSLAGGSFVDTDAADLRCDALAADPGVYDDSVGFRCCTPPR